MSLGFNPQRHPRVTNLPGAVGANVLSLPSSRRRVALLPSRAATRAAPPVAAGARAPSTTAPPSSATALLPRPPTPPKAHHTIAIVEPKRDEEAARLVHEAHEAAQWVYADAAVALQDLDTEEEVAPAGARVLLVYPMQTDANSGLVRMRLKAAHPITGQLRHHWVAVYDPECADAPHRVTRFSVVA